MNYTINGDIITITKEGVTVNLTKSEFWEIEESYNMRYYREDVINKIDVLIDSEDLPETAADNTDYINAVTELYNKYRGKYCDGVSCGVSWDVCLDMAFDDVDYEDFVI